jgi:hypothetical protein
MVPAPAHLVCLLLLGLLWVSPGRAFEDAAPAAAAAPSRGSSEDDARIAAGVARWRSRACPPAGCAGAPGNSLAGAAGFGACALAGAWLARRRERPRG